MLTGDKVETATSIAISSGLKARRDILFFMRELISKADVEDKINKLVKNITKTALIIDGKTLDTIM
jgi:magnesium-transporting ATPase (P-type)